MQNSIETTATIGINRHLILDDDIPAQISGKVRVIVLLDEDIDERLWTRSVSDNEAFDFLEDDFEDIYPPNDGFLVIDEA